MTYRGACSCPAYCVSFTCKIQGNTIYPIRFFVVLIKAKFIMNKQNDQQEARQSDSQTRDVDQRE